MKVLEIQNLKKYFGKTLAVDGISFSVEKGEIFLLFQRFKSFSPWRS